MKRTAGILGIACCFIFVGIVSLRAATIVDAAGKKVTVSPPYTRIISLYGAHTENLFSLGLDKEIIGVSRHEAYPPAATRKPVFSYHEDAEKFMAAHPDLILVRPMITRGYPALMRKLRTAGMTVVSLQPTTVKAMLSYWKTLGILTGREKAADRMITRFKRGVEIIRRMVAKIPKEKRKRVYFEAIHSRMKTFAPNAIAMFALTTAGGINVAADAKAVRGTNIAAYGKEQILSHAGEIDVFLAQRGAMNRVTKRKIREEGGFKAIKAVREGQIYIIDEKIVSRPTLRLLLGIYEIGRFLYPEVFNDVTALRKEKVLSRGQFAEMIVKVTRTPIKTPNYQRDILKKRKGSHHYRDVDYFSERSAYIETAVAMGLFRKADGSRFFPDKPILRGDVAFSLFMKFDLPEAKPVKIVDIPEDDPLASQAAAVAGLGIMTLNHGKFEPNRPMSGEAVFEALKKAQAVIERK